MRTGPLLAWFSIAAGCAAPQMVIDQEFAGRAEAYQADVKRDERQLIGLGPFLIESLGPITSSKIKGTDRKQAASHRFAFTLKDRNDAGWEVLCDVSMKWIRESADSTIQELSCSILDTTAQGNLPYRLRVSGTGRMLGLKSGELTQGDAILDIESAHLDGGSSKVGRLVGFQITHRNRVLSTVQTIAPVTVWLDRKGPDQLRSLAAACAVALAFYENVSDDV